MLLGNSDTKQKQQPVPFLTLTHKNKPGTCTAALESLVSSWNSFQGCKEALAEVVGGRDGSKWQWNTAKKPRNLEVGAISSR